MTAHRLAQLSAGDADPSRANVVGQWALDALAAGEDAQAKRGVEGRAARVFGDGDGGGSKVDVPPRRLEAVDLGEAAGCGK